MLLNDGWRVSGQEGLLSRPAQQKFCVCCALVLRVALPWDGQTLLLTCLSSWLIEFFCLVSASKLAAAFCKLDVSELLLTWETLHLHHFPIVFHIFLRCSHRNAGVMYSFTICFDMFKIITAI